MNLASAMLMAAAAQALERPPSTDLNSQLAEIATGDRGRRKAALKDVFLTKNPDIDRQILRDSVSFGELACMVATHLPVVCLFTDGPPGRSVAKLSYVEPLAIDHSASKGLLRRSFGWKSENLAVSINEVGAGESHHIEFSVPEDLYVHYVSLTGKSYTLANVAWQDLKEQEKDYSIRQVGTVSSGNLYLSGLPYQRRMGRASVKMHMKRTRFLMGAFVASAIITAILFVLSRIAGSMVNTDASDALVGALLLLPSVVATYIARPGEHMITARMLRWARFILVANAALPYLAIIAYLTTSPETQPASSGLNLGGKAERVLSLFGSLDSPAQSLKAKWLLLACCSFVLTCLFLLANILPGPHGASQYNPLPSEPE